MSDRRGVRTTLSELSKLAQVQPLLRIPPTHASSHDPAQLQLQLWVDTQRRTPIDITPAPRRSKLAQPCAQYVRVSGRHGSPAHPPARSPGTKAQHSPALTADW